MNADESEITWEAPGRALSTDMCLCSPPPELFPGVWEEGRCCLFCVCALPPAPPPFPHELWAFHFPSALLSCLGHCPLCWLCMLLLAHSAVRGPVLTCLQVGRGPAGQGADPGGMHLPQHSSDTQGTHCRICVLITGLWGVGGEDTPHPVWTRGVAMMSPQQAAGKYLLLSSR